MVERAILANDRIVASVSYQQSLQSSQVPQLVHLPSTATSTPQGNNLTTYHYPQAKTESFIIPGHADFIPSCAAVAHSRSLTFLKKYMQGPFFDLEAIWEEHTNFEFGDRSVANTMGTMVQEPYVNHIPTVAFHPRKIE